MSRKIEAIQKSFKLLQQPCQRSTFEQNWMWNAKAFTSEQSGHHQDICQKQIKNITRKDFINANKTEGSG